MPVTRTVYAFPAVATFTIAVSIAVDALVSATWRIPVPLKPVHVNLSPSQSARQAPTLRQTTPEILSPLCELPQGKVLLPNPPTLLLKSRKQPFR
jgi:hypothetical protein